jgi:hypothetical protein
MTRIKRMNANICRWRRSADEPQPKAKANHKGPEEAQGNFAPRALKKTARELNVLSE